MIKIDISDAAASAVVEQTDYYRLHNSESMVRKWLGAIERAILSLRSMPERGSARRWQHPSLVGLRSLSIPGFPAHLLLYRYDSATASLLIVLIVHGRRDVEGVLQQLS